MTPPAEKCAESTPGAYYVHCPQCEGARYGIETGTVPTCCGAVYPGGECRGHCAVPKQTQEQIQCSACGGTGFVAAPDTAAERDQLKAANAELATECKVLLGGNPRRHSRSRVCACQAALQRSW